ncbi:hypothetical protein KORDIASMS9_00268 [Kordia sp. SMS9]|uniref:hypothetical protein n=1 Tax=Kordia sp. SMS9 TaxID=2282170 RepID=UPI000E0DF59D|nr:hypothetical protein [Kordia sp. SMS9]AXG68078.1 hypothetical protein KORDIASMS9_00268 [Kordia sp. SMS9]
MKKKNLKNLALNRKTISNLKTSQSFGGNAPISVQCPLSLFAPTTCLVTVECYQTDNCIPVTKEECNSIFIDCITQTETPTCRDCA